MRRLTAACCLVGFGLTGCGGGDDAVRPVAGEPADRRTGDRKALGLTPSPSRHVVRACRRAERRSELAVVCPPVVPVGSTGVQWAGRLGGREGPAASYELQLTSPGLRQASDRSQPGHWAVAAARPPAVLRRALEPAHLVGTCRWRRARDLPTRSGPCAPARKRLELEGVPITELRMPPYPAGGVHGGHVVLVWQAAGVGYLLSVHDPANRRRARAMAAALVRRTTLADGVRPKVAR